MHGETYVHRIASLLKMGLTLEIQRRRHELATMYATRWSAESRPLDREQDLIIERVTERAQAMFGGTARLTRRLVYALQNLEHEESSRVDRTSIEPYECWFPGSAVNHRLA